MNYTEWVGKVGCEVQIRLSQCINAVDISSYEIWFLDNIHLTKASAPKNVSQSNHPIINIMYFDNSLSYLKPVIIIDPINNIQLNSFRVLFHDSDHLKPFPA